MRYLIYQRVSTEMQDVTAQIENCIHFVERKPDYETHAVYQDPDTSSRIPWKERMGLCQMLEEIKKGDQIVIPRLDRLGRDIIEIVTIYRKIRSQGAEIFSMAEGVVADWMLGILGALAQKEREDISLRTKSTMKAMSQRGERVGHIPFGLQLADPSLRRTKENRIEGVRIKLKDNPEEIRILKEMEKQRASGASYRQLAAYLNSKGYLNRGNPWNHVSVSRVWKGFSARHQKSLGRAS